MTLRLDFARMTLAAAALAVSCWAAAVPARGEEAPSPVSGLKRAEFDAVIAQLKAVYDERRPDVVLFGEDHCNPQAAQFLSAPSTLDLHAGFVAGFVEEPRQLQQYHDIIVKTAARPRASEQDRHDARMLENQLVKFQSKELAYVCAVDSGGLRAAAEISTAKKMAARGQAFVDSDYNEKATAALEKEYEKSGDARLKKQFVQVRLDERKLAADLRAAAQKGPVWVLRGYRHVLQTIPGAPTTLRENLAGVRVLAIAFDYSGHDVADALADIERDGYAASPPDFVIRVTPGRSAVLPYTGDR